MKRKLGVVVAAIVLGSHLGSAIAAEPSPDQLAEIEALLSNNDVRALRRFLEDNRELLAGDTQLAILLRRFLEESENITNFLTYAPDLRDALILPQPEEPIEEPPVDEGSDSGDEPGGGGDPDDVPGGGGDPDGEPGGGGDPDGEPLY